MTHPRSVLEVYSPRYASEDGCVDDVIGGDVQLFAELRLSERQTRDLAITAFDNGRQLKQYRAKHTRSIAAQGKRSGGQ